MPCSCRQDLGTKTTIFQITRLSTWHQLRLITRHPSESTCRIPYQYYKVSSADCRIDRLNMCFDRTTRPMLPRREDPKQFDPFGVKIWLPRHILQGWTQWTFSSFCAFPLTSATFPGMSEVAKQVQQLFQKWEKECASYSKDEADWSDIFCPSQLPQRTTIERALQEPPRSRELLEIATRFYSDIEEFDKAVECTARWVKALA